jgi:selenoprotein W-related protein
LASQILSEFKQHVSALTLVPASGGCFELSVDGELLYSKLKTGEFPDEARVVGQLGKRLKVKTG